MLRSQPEFFTRFRRVSSWTLQLGSLLGSEPGVVFRGSIVRLEISDRHIYSQRPSQQSLPTSLNNLLFATGMTVMYWIAGHLGTAEVAAVNVLINLMLTLVRLVSPTRSHPIYHKELRVQIVTPL
jgi:hypothetical protein